MSDLGVNPRIQQASTLPASFYRSREIFERSVDVIFAASWQFAGEDTFPANYTVKPFRLLDGFLPEPLLFTQTEGQIQCLSNVCTHRGNLLIPQAGHLKNLVCRYHGRKFDLSGNFQFMPQFDEVENFPSDCDNLPKVPLARWKQFLFVALAPKLDFDTVFEPLKSRISFLPVEQFKFDEERSNEYEVNAHWALYCDNYLEGFHIPFVHQGLNQSISYPDYETVLYDHCNLQIGFAKDGTEHFDLPEDHVDHGRKVAAYYFWIFPNMMFNFYPWGLSVNIVKPVDLNKTKVSFLSYVWDESKIESSAGEFLDKVEKEDEEVVEAVHQGLKSRFYDKGRFSPAMEKGVHHFHSLLAKYLKQ